MKAKLWISKINTHLLISVVLFSFIEAQELIFLHRRDHNWWPGSSNKPNQHFDSRKASWEGIGINKKRLWQKNQEVANI